MTGLIRTALVKSTLKKNITVDKSLSNKTMTAGKTSNAILRCFKLYGDCSTAAILVFQTNPVLVELFPCVNAFFCSNECAFMLAT